jgi:hypothetical protein
MLRMFLFANSSMHPAWTPPRTVIGTPASKVKASWAVLMIVKSAPPRALISAPACVLAVSALLKSASVIST